MLTASIMIKMHHKCSFSQFTKTLYNRRRHARLKIISKKWYKNFWRLIWKYKNVFLQNFIFIQRRHFAHFQLLVSFTSTVNTGLNYANVRRDGAMWCHIVTEIMLWLPVSRFRTSVLTDLECKPQNIHPSSEMMKGIIKASVLRNWNRTFLVINWQINAVLVCLIYPFTLNLKACALACYDIIISTDWQLPWTWRNLYEWIWSH